MSLSNLPPGCSNRDIENAFGEVVPCGICHKDPELEATKGGCSCEECPECGAQGDLACYQGGKCGGLKVVAPTAHTKECHICHPRVETCPKHGEYLWENGCCGCEQDAADADEAYMNSIEFGATVGGLQEEISNDDLVRADFAFDAAREASHFRF
jgi:hypothetical protein